MEELDFSGCHITNEGAVVIATALAGNASVKKLTMTHNQAISSDGWIEFFRLLADRETSFVGLDLGYNCIDDAGAAKLTNILSKMSALVSLNLAFNRSITSTGWCALADLLKPTSAAKLKELTVLDLRGEQSDNDVVICYAEALAGNTSLEKLTFFGQVLVKESGWKALVKALNTNHTLKKIFCSMSRRPEELGILLDMNENENKAEVAQKKIMMHHSSDEEKS